MTIGEPIKPIEYARTRRNPLVVLAVSVERNEALHRFFLPKNYVAAIAVRRALRNALATRGLLLPEGLAGEQLGAELNLTAYFFDVTQLAPALETLREEARELRLPNSWIVIGYWCADEGIYRPWHPERPTFDLHKCVEQVNWEALSEIAQIDLVSITEALELEAQKLNGTENT